MNYCGVEEAAASFKRIIFHSILACPRLTKLSVSIMACSRFSKYSENNLIDFGLLLYTFSHIEVIYCVYLTKTVYF